MASVLIVDDSATETLQMSKWLNNAGHTVLTAANGEQGIDMARSEQPDLVVMDIVMPGLNGFQATRQLNKDQSTNEIPVVIVTSKDQEADRVWGERQGARAFLTKPVNEKTLLTTIDALIA